MPKQLPSQRLKDWLDRRLGELRPGDRLPTDRQLATGWGLSVRTVVEIMQDLARRGAVVRIRGKGTFVPRLAESGADDHIAPPRTSVQNVVDFFDRAMCSGELREGEALPPVKYVAHRFKVAPSTVIRAYRTLQQRGMAVKVGKTYWHGTFDSLVREPSKREVFAFVDRANDWQRVFGTNTYGLVYRRLDNILYRHGYLVRCEDVSGFNKRVGQWVRDRRLPYGLVFAAMDGRKLERVREGIEMLRRERGGVDLPVVMDWAGGDFARIPKGVHTVYRIGATGIAGLARYLVGRNRTTATFFVDAECLRENNFRFWIMWDFLALRPELRRLCPSFRWRIVVLAPDRPAGRRESFLQSFPLSAVERVLSKYEPTTFESVRDDIVFVKDGGSVFSRFDDADIWVFQKDRHAAAALQWAESHRKRIPRDKALLSLDDDQRYYHLGLSRYEIDWEGIGYMMAHAIVGDLPMEKTDEGFIRVRSRIVEKLTT